jgi:peptidoglycan/xylan/chitin deacetylase (PgdA/CDA1 family)
LNLFRTPFFLPKFYPSLLWRLPTVNKELYLTFDDGPVHGPTEFVLDELKRFNAKASFFCIGDNVRKYPDVFEKVIAGGHTVGNHTFNHLKGWSTPLPRYLENVKECEEQFKVAGYQLPSSNSEQQTFNHNYFRPPYGRITGKQINALKEKYEIVMWDVLTHDYSKSISRQNCLNGSINATRPGSIIVFHDSLKAERNLTHVLPKFLEHFSSQGYEFKSLSNA